MDCDSHPLTQRCCRQLTHHHVELELVFDKLNVKAHAEGAALTSPALTGDLKKLKREILDEEAPKTIAAGDFDTEMAITTFGLGFVDYGPEYLSQTVGRSSEAACRTPVDLILIECVAELVSSSVSFLAVLTCPREP